MNKKVIAILVSLVTAGASASVFGAAACCAAPGAQNSEAAQAASTPARMILASYEKVSNALAADNLADAQAAARTMAAVADITGTKMACPSGASKDCGDKEKCDDSRKACGDKAASCDSKKECCGEGKGCSKSLQALIEAESLEAAREEFKLVSAQAIQLAEGEEGFFVISCGMADAEWLQSDEEVRNPYHGSEMLRCGVIKAKAEGATGAE